MNRFEISMVMIMGFTAVTGLTALTYIGLNLPDKRPIVSNSDNAQEVCIRLRVQEIEDENVKTV